MREEGVLEESATEGTPEEAGPARPRVWQLFAVWVAVIALIFLPFLVAGVVLSVQQPGALKDPAETSRLLEEIVSDPSTMMASYAWVPAVQIVAALLVGTLSQEPLMRRLRLGRGRFGPGRFAVAALGVVATSATLAIALRLLPSFGDETLQQFSRFATTAEGGSWWTLLFLAGIAAPLAEELFYRGALQTRMVERFGPAAGIAVTSAMFAAAHFSPAHVLTAFVLGAYLGWIAWISGSCGAAIFAHVINNSLAVAGASAAASAVFERSHALLTGAGWLAVAAGCAWLLWSAPRAPASPR